MNTRPFITLLFFSLCFIISFSHSLRNSFSFELIHRDSSKSPLYKPAQNKFQHVVNAARRSINRANRLFKDSLSNTPESTVYVNGGEYLMTYSVGTPPFNVYGVVDTGSDIVWLQCKPCEQCYKQTTPIFNPSKSSSYKNIPCSSNLCQSVRYTSCNKQNSCEYTINFSDQSYSQGELSVETLTLDSTTGHSVSFPKTVIGCGHNNRGMFQGETSGIVGLGIGPVSLTTQLKSSIGGKFSYCLLPLLVDSNKTSKLNFGDAAVVSGDGVVSTPFVKKDPQAFYYLTLEAFSVGNKRIEFEVLDDSEEGNIILDSGTTLTLLPSHVYTNLESAVAQLVKLDRVDDPNQLLNLCYSITSDQYDFPIITAHFKGADIKLNPISTFAHVADGVVCLAFTSSQTGPIFGNLAQLNLLVGYDLQQNIVSFKPSDCIKV
ncbi:putative nepenthesin [Medicago truncatula]|uniref:Eukaryotic aspartyl protease family protein n=1 Tax=Medicago truncatula TaxID=3880 RepID=G7JY07_MEDTR|nr:aspartic proteinase CDR1 [Medicago truncatula]AES97061.1 eukaryotic aspartyl protease family protein [Medicago truncatula]RHN55571.1 putative nepenthesin [Medicago truncatula]